MPKAKLSDAVKAANAESETETPASETPETPAAETPDTTEKPDATNDDGDDGPESSAAGNAGTPAAGSLESFREAFGHEQGSVYFADETPFADACVSHIATLNETNASQATEIETLKAQNAELAKEVHGTKDPLELGSEDETDGANAVNAIKKRRAARFGG